MNIFILSKDPAENASYHCNKHICKMIVESGQMLCAAHWYSLLRERNKTLSDFKGVKIAKNWLVQNSPTDSIPPYSFTHARHPCVTWTSQNTANYQWHLQLFRCLLDEYTQRYKRQHKCEEVWRWLCQHQPGHMSHSTIMTDFVLAMSDDCKVSGDAVASYRKYYRERKRSFAKWEPHAKTPDWF